MLFETIAVGPLGENCYILGCEDTREGIIVDPGAEPERILGAAAASGLKIKYVINTHGHFDHIGANRKVLEATGAKLLIHEADREFLTKAADVARMYGLATDNSPDPDQFLEEGMKISFGAHEITVLHTPGHTPGCCCLYLPHEATVITGDTLFADGIGRTDFPGSSYEAIVESIKTKLYTLPDATAAYPGHGPSTTIGREKRYNPYVN